VKQLYTASIFLQYIWMDWKSGIHSVRFSHMSDLFTEPCGGARDKREPFLHALHVS